MHLKDAGFLESLAIQVKLGVNTVEQKAGFAV